MKILLASPIHPKTIKNLTTNHDVLSAFNADELTLMKKIRDRDVLIFRSGVQISRKVMESAPELKLLVRAGSGLDNIDLEYLEQSDLTLVRVPIPSARAVAEMAFALMLGLARQLLIADSQSRKGHWVKYEIEGYLLENKVLGIIGAGNIGSTVGELGVAWGMEVVGCVEYLTDEIADPLRGKGIQPMNCHEVLSKADFVSIHVPFNERTRNMIGAEALSLMKPGAFLINLSRGGVVDEEALLEALKERKIKGAAIDVHVEEGEGKISPLAGLSNVILTPHIGSMTEDTQYKIGERVVEIINNFSLNDDSQQFVPKISVA